MIEIPNLTAKEEMLYLSSVVFSIEIFYNSFKEIISKHNSYSGFKEKPFIDLENEKVCLYIGLSSGIVLSKAIEWGFESDLRQFYIGNILIRII